MSNLPLPNRLAVYITGAIALLAGLTPLIGNLDWESTAGVVAGLLAILGVVYKWLDNWGKWERGEGNALLPGELDDEFDEDTAEPIPDDVVDAANRPAVPTPASGPGNLQAPLEEGEGTTLKPRPPNA